MDLIERVQGLSAQIPRLEKNILTEEATKTSLVMPFISMLGYNVFDPAEVIPEFIADHGIKKGEKVDYAIFKDGSPIMLIECKKIGTNLDQEKTSQLFRYFNVTGAKVGVLTNGTIYRFFSDLEKPNIMDDKAFLEMDLQNLKEELVEQIKRFSKDSFNIDDLTNSAKEMKYISEIKKLITKEMENPSVDYVKYFARQVYPGVITKAVQEEFSELTKRAMGQFIMEKIEKTIKKGLEPSIESPDNGSGTPKPIGEPMEVKEAGEIITTPSELEGFYYLKSILRDIIDTKRVVMRDNKSYCALLLDDNNRKTICRFYFDSKQKYIGMVDENKTINKVKIDDVDDIYKHSESLKITVQRYDENSGNKGGNKNNNSSEKINGEE